MPTLISIVGPVCVGKTTLAEKLADALPARLLREEYDSNPFLAESYEYPELQTALAAQLFFLMSRTRQMAQCNLQSGEQFISDYGFAQDAIFARLKLSEEEWRVYEPLAAQAWTRVVPPSVLIHLDAPTEVLMNRIAARGRDFEAVFTPDFIETLRRANAEIIPPENCQVIRVDTHESDFRENGPFAELLEMIQSLTG